MATEEDDVVRPLNPVELENDIRAIVSAKENKHSRSVQMAIGPSEIGDSCDRRLAYKAAKIPAPKRKPRSNWLATLGTQAHKFLSEAFDQNNEDLGHERWITEQKVQITPSIWGTVDLYDIDTATVIDHKVLGNASYHEIKMGRLPKKYRVQLHMYGMGYEDAGAPVVNVALALYSRTDDLDGTWSKKPLFLYHEPYDRDIARKALLRYKEIMDLTDTLQVKTYPEKMAQIPTAEDAECRFCPFYKPGHGPADGEGCPGMDKDLDKPLSIPGIT